MPRGFSYTLLRDWFDAEAERDKPELANLLPHQRLLLLSDGSLTLDLELLWKSMVDVEVKHKGVTTLSKEDADYLEESPDKGALEREVWLTIDSRKLVYARSVIPHDRINRELLDDLEAHSEEPLGRVLTTRKVFFSKKKLELSVVRCEEAALDLGLEEKTPLIARRYILFNLENPESWIIKASVTEIFSPEIIEGDAIKSRPF